MSLAESPSGLLPHLGILRFTGADAAVFLQGQVSNDTRRLAEAEGVLAAYSSPQGRVLAVLRLIPHSSGILAILPRELVLPTLESLRRFVLRAKVTLEDASELLRVCGHHDARLLAAAHIAAPTSAKGYLEHDGIGVAGVEHGSGRFWVVGTPEKLAEHGLMGVDLPAAQIENAWRLADIRDGIPQIYLSTREVFVAQMLNLDRLDGISFSKGCYTGQEIIARTQHLGRIKRRLYRLSLPDGQWTVGQTIKLNDGRAGRVVEAARDQDGVAALAVLNVEASAGSSGGAVEDTESAANPAIAAIQVALPYSLS